MRLSCKIYGIEKENINKKSSSVPIKSSKSDKKSNQQNTATPFWGHMTGLRKCSLMIMNAIQKEFSVTRAKKQQQLQQKDTESMIKKKKKSKKKYSKQGHEMLC